MKRFPITSPDQLRDLTKMVKWDKDKQAVMVFADNWYNNPGDCVVQIEMGKSAQVVAYSNRKRDVLATLYTAAAKDYIRGVDVP